MMNDNDLSILSPEGAPCLVTLVAEPPGALAVFELDVPQADTVRNFHVLRLAPPRRGRRFGSGTPVGRILRDLHAQNRLAEVRVNLPERLCTEAEFEARQGEWPDLRHLLRRLERMQVRTALTRTPLWRPYCELPHKGLTYAEISKSYGPKVGLEIVPEYDQCFDAILLGFFTVVVERRFSLPTGIPDILRMH